MSVSQSNQCFHASFSKFVGSRPGTAGAATGEEGGGGWASPEFSDRGESRLGYMQGGRSADLEGAAAAGMGVGEGEEGDRRRGVTAQGLTNGSKEGDMVQQEQQGFHQQQLVVDGTLQQHDKRQQTAVAVA